MWPFDFDFDLDAYLNVSDTFVFISGVIILLQVVYLALNMFKAKQVAGRLTWKRMIYALTPTRWPETIFDILTIALIIRDLVLLLNRSPRLQLGSLMLVVMLVLFVVANSLERYSPTKGISIPSLQAENAELKAKVAELEARLEA